MPRNTATVTIEAEGRDFGKTYKLTEMDAWSGDKWATRLLLAAFQTGAPVSESDVAAGWQGIWRSGIFMALRIPPDTLIPLLDELMECVRYQPPNAKLPPQAILSSSACQIEELATFWRLRLALVELHTGFSLPVASPSTVSATGSTTGAPE